jgi:hypothetical protein
MSELLPPSGIGLTLEEIGAELAKLPPHRGAHPPRLVAPLGDVDVPRRLAGLELDPRHGLRCKARRQIIIPCA